MESYIYTQIRSDYLGELFLNDWGKDGWELVYVEKRNIFYLYKYKLIFKKKLA